MVIQTTRGPNGEAMVLLNMDEYEDLVDACRHEAAMQPVVSGAMETLFEEDAAAYLAAKTRLAFWRCHRNVTQQALAAAVGVSQAYIAQIENGVPEGEPGHAPGHCARPAGQDGGPGSVGQSALRLRRLALPLLLTHRAAHR